MMIAEAHYVSTSGDSQLHPCITCFFVILLQSTFSLAQPKSSFVLPATEFYVSQQTKKQNGH